MGQPVNHGCGHHRIRKDFFPTVKGEIGGNNGGFSTSPQGQMGKE